MNPLTKEEEELVAFYSVLERIKPKEEIEREEVVDEEVRPLKKAHREVTESRQGPSPIPCNPLDLIGNLVSNDDPTATSASSTSTSTATTMTTSTTTPTSASGDGKKLDRDKFAAEFVRRDQDFDTRKAEKALWLKCPDYHPESFQTLALKITVPAESASWAFNICPKEQGDEELHDDVEHVYFHFNPRRRERQRGTLVQNNKKDGVWGDTDRSFLAKFSFSLYPTFRTSLSIEIIVQISQDIGFHTYVDGRIGTVFRHREELEPPKPGDDLYFHVPLTDDNGAEHEVIIHQVWWGHVPFLHKEINIDPKTLTGDSALEAGDPCRIFIRNLPIRETIADDMTVRDALRKVLEPYGCIELRVIEDRGIAFARMEKTEEASRAIEELHDYSFHGFPLTVLRARPRG